MEIEREMEHGVKYPFERITQLNIGNPQNLGQKPISFNREVLACCLYDHPRRSEFFSKDAVERANFYLESLPHRATGGYSDSGGYRTVIAEVKDYINKRDDINVDMDDIYLLNGASEGIATMLRLLIKDDNDAIMIPIPQYPIYSALITKFGGKQVPYYLNENRGWGLDLNDLEKSYQDARENGINMRGIVIINPGNPTGQILSQENLQSVLKFAHDKNLVVLADEVYQKNIYVDKEFVSARKALRNLGPPFDNNLELVSFHSLSKGLLGECGLRGGYMELHNFDHYAMEMVYKSKAVNLCSNTIGQIGTGLMVNPPNEFNASQATIDQYKKEETDIYDALKVRAKLLSDGLNAINGISCTEVEGAMYAFPNVDLPTYYIEDSVKSGIQPDLRFCLKVLEETGIMIVPGSGFGQMPLTYHFRITNLINSTDDMKSAIHKIQKVTDKIMAGP